LREKKNKKIIGEKRFEDLRQLELKRVEEQSRLELKRVERTKTQTETIEQIKNLGSTDITTGEVVGLFNHQPITPLVIEWCINNEDRINLSPDELKFCQKQEHIEESDQKRLKIIKIKILRSFHYNIDRDLSQYGIQHVSCRCGYQTDIILKNINQPTDKFICGSCRGQKCHHPKKTMIN